MKISQFLQTEQVELSNTYVEELEHTKKQILHLKELFALSLRHFLSGLTLKIYNRAKREHICQGF